MLEVDESLGLSTEKLEEAKQKGFLSPSEYAELKNERQKVVRYMDQHRRLPQQGFGSYKSTNGNYIKEFNGEDVGWEKDHLYSKKLKRHLTRKEERERLEPIEKWKQELREKRDKGIHATSFIGVDGNTYQLAPGLEGVLEIVECIREAGKRYSQGKVSWEDLKHFLVVFPYEGQDLCNGNDYESKDLPNPRGGAEVGMLEVLSLISRDQYYEFGTELEALRDDLKSNGVIPRRGIL